LGVQSRQRDLLIEFLHLIQDKFGCLRHRHLAALAAEMRLSMTEVFEVATFYAHFDVVPDDVTPPEITVRVCDSVVCAMKGARELIEELNAQVPVGVRVVPAPCMGRCADAPTAEVGHYHVDSCNPKKVLDAVGNKKTEPALPNYPDFDQYQNDDGYNLLRSCLAGEHSVDTIIQILDQSGLKGLGGAGFPTARKWTFVRGYPGPRLMAVNADEGEPGTFKDRYFMENDPHRVLEGTLIAAWAVEAESIYFYLRDEYPGIRKLLQQEIEKLDKAGLTRHAPIILRRGAGAYICGEESSMIESIEGKRGLPRHRPPYVAEVGIFGRPTLVQNVETLYWVRDIVEKGAQWFADQGKGEAKGLRSYSVSGRVRDPGVKIAPAGTTIRELINDYCGGMEEGHTFKGYLPGGASGGILPASLDDLPLDFGTLQKYGCFIGSAAIVVFSDQDRAKDVALNLMRFFEDESCGQCTPCRSGTEKAVTFMSKNKWDEFLLKELGATMTDASICGLGQAAANPLLSVFKYFREEL
nr:NAD(P)H-dependent oxidoreductase subunit E [Arenicellales bacterium]